MTNVTINFVEATDGKRTPSRGTSVYHNGERIPGITKIELTGSTEHDWQAKLHVNDLQLHESVVAELAKICCDNIWESAVLDAAMAVVKASQAHTGQEPSTSVLNRNIDELRCILDDAEAKASQQIASVSAEQECREQFETWADGEGFCLDAIWSSDGAPFENKNTALAFETWKASRATMIGYQVRAGLTDPVNAREMIANIEKNRNNQ